MTFVPFLLCGFIYVLKSPCFNVEIVQATNFLDRFAGKQYMVEQTDHHLETILEMATGFLASCGSRMRESRVMEGEAIPWFVM